ncbi:ABC transporter ATP-binding protein [Chloroflexota bacterium]
MHDIDMDGRTVLQLADVVKVFSRGTVDEVTALNHVNISVYESDFITIIGSNGAGKSTLLNIIAGVYPPERGGKVYIRGNDVTNLAEHRRAGYVGRVWQEPQMGTSGGLTIEENMSLAFLRRQRKGLGWAVTKMRRDLFRERLSLLGLGLEDRLSVSTGTLSGGQRQALALVMATIGKPTILLLDEHVASLDPKTAKTVLSMTDDIVRADEVTAVVVTHNMDVALRHGNRLIMMHEGRIILDIGEAKKKVLSVEDLVRAFEQAAGETFDDDSVLLTQRE